MKRFLSRTLSSCLGTLIAFAVLGLLGIAIGSAYSKKQKVPKKGFLHLQLDGYISDYSKTNFDLRSLSGFQSTSSIHDIKMRVEQAISDPKIKGIFLEVHDVKLSQVTAIELMEILSSFKSNGKKIISFSNYFNQNAYVAASVSDSIFLNPSGGIGLKGYAFYSQFYLELAKELGIEFNVEYVGDYKGSIEPFTLSGYSEKNKAQLRSYLDILHEQLIKTISDNRQLDPNNLKRLISGHHLYDAEIMKDSGLVDGLKFRQQVLDDIFGKNIEKELIPLMQYKLNPNKKKAEIAVVYGEGEIVWDEAGQSSFSYQKISEVLNKISKNKNIKQVILRLNSPGGNGFASELLHHEIEELKKSGKKVYASFGPLATSGAYYIASACDTIFAEANTMTGSIGVYIMLPTFEGFLKDKLKIDSDSILYGGNQLGYNPVFSMTELEKERLRSHAEELYSKFVDHVVEGRGMSRDSVLYLAQGKIWTGIDAKNVGLVDEIGGLDDLLRLIGEKSKSGQERIAYFPEQNTSVYSSIISNFDGFLNYSKNSDNFNYKKIAIDFKNYLTLHEPQIALPFHISVR